MIRKVVFLLIVPLVFSSCHPNIKDSFKSDQEIFIRTINDFFTINEKTTAYYQNNKLEYLDQVLELTNHIRRIIASSDSVSDEYLDFIHPNLKYQYRENYLKSFKQLLENITPNPDMNKAQNLDMKLKSFAEFIVQNEVSLNDKFEKVKSKNKVLYKIKRFVSTDDTDKKSFLRMMIRFIIATGAVILIFSFYLSGFFLLTYPFLSLTEKIKSGFSTLLSILIFIVLGIAQIYFWIIWAAYLSTNVHFYVNSPEVKHNWIYYAAAFFFVGGPLGWLSYKESQTEQSSDRTKSIQSGTTYYSLISFVAFVIFCIWPNLTNFKFFSIVLDIFR